MFDLEQSITAWRQQMLAAGIQSPVPLEELEAHLREEIEQRLKTGLDPQTAFEAAIQHLGRPQLLKTEFNKTESTFMNRKLILLVGIFILLLGTCMILPALGQHKEHNHDALAAGANFFNLPWRHNELVGLTWGSLLALGGVATTVYSLKKRKA